MEILSLFWVPASLNRAIDRLPARIKSMLPRYSLIQRHFRFFVLK